MEKYNWTTEFNTTSNYALHTFSEDIFVIADFNADQVRIIVKGETKNVEPLSEYTVAEYENYLLAIAKSFEG